MKLITNDLATPEVNLIKLEYAIVSHFRPTFLYISKPNDQGDVEIIISCVKFKFLNIQERVTEVFNLIDKRCSDIISNRLVIIQCFDTEEMETVLMEIFK